MDDLDRFVVAQAGSYGRALEELRRGRKASHWMWFVFPQIAGLGRSEAARFYAIRDLGEARAYLAHPLLGPRLRECTAALLAHPAVSAEDVLGDVDAIKLRSSMTLFEAADGGPEFAACLNACFVGSRDTETLRLVRRD